MMWNVGSENINKKRINYLNASITMNTYGGIRTVYIALNKVCPSAEIPEKSCKGGAVYMFTKYTRTSTGKFFLE